MIKKIILIAIITLEVIACSSNSGEELIYAARYGDLETVKLLIENGTDINAKNNDWGYTPLIYVSEYGNLETVQFLIGKGANVNIKNNEGKTALDLAKTEEIKEVLRKAKTK